MMGEIDISTSSVPGIQTFVALDGVWKISTRKQPILKADPIEVLSNDIGIPVPEMIFGDNLVAIEHLPSNWRLEFNAHDALDLVSKTEKGMLQVAVAAEWKKERARQEEVKQVVKPFDWSYSTPYKGTTRTGTTSSVWRSTTPDLYPIRVDLLSRPDPILFFDAVDLYEDELADNGIALLSVKVRVMPERLLLLSRFFLRLDGVTVRIRDTRVYIEHDRQLVIRQYTAKEESYETLYMKLREQRHNVSEAFRDPNQLAPHLSTKEDVTEVFDLS